MSIEWIKWAFRTRFMTADVVDHIPSNADEIASAHICCIGIREKRHVGRGKVEG